ncbi:MMPL family transporter [Buchananella felis]|uniref:MMPL family transporter n=1 Tax=Buchananella felis TaxID=3231492 RepID=UPI003526EEB6
MFTRLVKLCLRFPKQVAGTWIVLFVISLLVSTAGVTGKSIFDLLGNGETVDSASRSHQGKVILEELRGSQEPVTALVTGVNLNVLAPQDVAAALAEQTKEISSLPGVSSVVSPFVLEGMLDNPVAAGMVATDRRGFLVLANFDPHAPAVMRAIELEEASLEDQRNAVNSAMAQLGPALADVAPNAKVVVSSAPIMFDEVLDQVKADLVTGEAIAFPASLLIMVLIFGGFLAAGMPLLGAAASIVSALGVLWIVAHFLSIESFVLNVVTVLGLGLSIDYGMLYVSRYREELARLAPEILAAEQEAATDPRGLQLRRGGRGRGRRHPGEDPLIATTLTNTMIAAGRTVFFSALTVALSILGLAVMRPEMLKSISAGAITVILLALISSVTLVPAVLVLLGRRLLKPSVVTRLPVLRAITARLADVSTEEGVFSRLARSVHKRPWWYLVGSLAVLGAMLVPLRSSHLVFSTVELLPAHSSQRVFLSQVEQHFPAAAQPDITLLTQGGPEESSAWVEGTIAHVAGVAGVSAPMPIDGHTMYAIDVDGAANSPTADAVVRAIYRLDSPTPVWLVGQAPVQVDFWDALMDGLPLSVSIIMLATFVLLFLMSGSLLIPLKALLVNAISLFASLGVSSWIFTNGIGESVLNYTSTGGLELMVVAVSLAFGFGLAMDYEVFLLARMKEYWDAGKSNDEAVELALQRSGRIVTSAALIICVVFLGFVAGDLLVIKQLGVTLTLIVAIDATLVRMILVPATMTLLGKWNWWAPAPLRRIYERFSIQH